MTQKWISYWTSCRCIFTSTFKWYLFLTALQSYVYLFFLPSVLPAFILLDFLPLSLFSPLWQASSTWLSLIFSFSPPFLYSLPVTVFFFSNTSLLSPSDAFFSSSLLLLLCLAYFRHHPPLSCFLLCVCCLFRLTLCSSKGMNPYTCQSVVEDAVHLLLPQGS